MAGASLHFRWCSRRIQRRGNEMLVCTACRFTTSGRRGCTGRLRNMGQSIFGDHTGFYSLEGDYPVFHVECVTRRKEPIYLTTVVGPPPQEDFYMGHAVERVFLPVMKMQYPEIVDVAMPAEGIFHNLMIVAIRKSYPGHARKIMNAIWSLGQAMFTKVIVVVDHDVNVQNS